MTVLWIALAAAGLLLLAMGIRTACFTKKAQALQPPADVNDRVPDQEIADHLSAVIRCATVSNEDPALVDWSEFEKLHACLRVLYPNVHRVMEREQLAGYNLIYRWKGTDPHRKPIAFLSHQDVVPVGERTEWNHAPFSGLDDGENIHGRGAMDMKQQLVMVMDACERLIAEGYTPEEDVYLCFGQNEEVGNIPDMTGADLLAHTLKQRGIRFDCVIDEGGTIVSGKTFGITPRVAVIGVAEKGFCDFRLEAESEGGHSSSPPRRTALGRVCQAAYRLETHPPKPEMLPSIRTMFETVAPYMKSLPVRFMVANLWLCKGLFMKLAGSNSLIRAVLANTYAVTQAQGSPQDNLLAQHPWIGVNCRILPGSDAQKAKAHIEKVIKDPKVKVTVTKYYQEHGVSPHKTNAFSAMDAIINRYYPGTLVTPYIQFGGSDSRNYYQVSENVYRFMPLYLEHDINEYGVHRANEYLPKEVLGRGVAFFMDFIKEYKGEHP